MTLYNEGNDAYRPSIYGKRIQVERLLGTTIGYKVRCSAGKVIASTYAEVII